MDYKVTMQSYGPLVRSLGAMLFARGTLTLTADVGDDYTAEVIGVEAIKDTMRLTIRVPEGLADRVKDAVVHGEPVAVTPVDSATEDGVIRQHRPGPPSLASRQWTAIVDKGGRGSPPTTPKPNVTPSAQSRSQQ